MNNETRSEQKCHVCNSVEKLKPSLELDICEVCYDKMVKDFQEYQSKRTTFFPEIDIIDEKVCLGNDDGGRDLELLKNFGITHVLVVGNFLDIKFPNEFTYMKISIDDSIYQDISQHFDKAIEFMLNSKKVYVHCAAGVSRSASIVIAYCMKTKGQSFDSAYAFVRSRRSCIYPNSGFQEQLKKYESKLNEEKNSSKPSLINKIKNFF